MFFSLDNMMPKIVSSCGDHFGVTLPEVLGSPVPIQAVLADQSASVFGSGKQNWTRTNTVWPSKKYF